VAATPSLRVRTSIPYRGSTRYWSTTFHFNGGTPADGTHWTTFSDALVTAFKACFTSGLTIVGTYGYAAGNQVPVFSKTYSTAGTLAGATPCPGDSAAMLRWSTAARSSKNHPVYLWNWIHGANWSGSGSSDTLLAAQKTAIDGFAGTFISPGFSDGTNSYVRAGPNGATATGHQCDPYVRHRDFPL
jgi:hypothetical protein